jgi:hypothetical protein
MDDKLTIVTNNVPRDIVEAWELTPNERKEFDYLDWEAIEAGNDSASFFRYRGEVYDLGEFTAVPSADRQPMRPFPRPWQAYQSDSYFSGILIQYVADDYDSWSRVIVGRYYS